VSVMLSGTDTGHNSNFCLMPTTVYFSHKTQTATIIWTIKFKLPASLP